MKMKKLSEYLFMGALGGTLYYMIEIIFRGYSHWSMFLLGGICFIFFAQQGLWTKWREPLWKQVIVNKVMGWNVWNYTDQPFHLMGQICFPFAVLFSGLCTFGIIISGYLLCYLYREIKPGFHIL